MRFFTADTHFGHGLSFRGFSSVEEHDDHLIRQINQWVGRKDELFIIGDFGCGTLPSLGIPGGKSKAIGHYRQRINCRTVVLILGNHDKAAQCTANFSNVYEKLEIKLRVADATHKLYMDHYPACYWPSSHYGSMHLYGHVHAYREHTLDVAFPGRRSMDAGMDNAFRLFREYRPFCEHEIRTLLLSHPGHDHVEFYRG